MANPSTDLPNSPSAKPTWSFHERYASDPEFKRQVDDGRRRSQQATSQAALQSALTLSSTGAGQKLY